VKDVDGSTFVNSEQVPTRPAIIISEAVRGIQIERHPQADKSYYEQENEIGIRKGVLFWLLLPELGHEKDQKGEYFQPSKNHA